MVQAMEAWLLSDKNALKNFYNHQGFNENALPKRDDIENISKKDMKAHLEKATKETKKGTYNKGTHSFEILERVTPTLVTKKSLWAERFINQLLTKMC